MSWTIDTLVRQELWKSAVRCAPNEACGYLLDTLDGVFLQLVHAMNLAQDPTKEFWLHPEEFAQYQHSHPGAQVAIWHSHPYGRWDLSRADRHLMVVTQVPMVVVAWQPWPSVSLYELQEGQIRRVVSYQVEGVTV